MLVLAFRRAKASPCKRFPSSASLCRLRFQQSTTFAENFSIGPGRSPEAVGSPFLTTLTSTPAGLKHRRLPAKKLYQKISRSRRLAACDQDNDERTVRFSYEEVIEYIATRLRPYSYGKVRSLRVNPHAWERYDVNLDVFVTEFLSEDDAIRVAREWHDFLQEHHPMCASPFKSRSGGRRYIGDIGAHNHMVDHEDCTSDELKSLVTFNPPIIMATSAGPVSCNQQVTIGIKPLNILVDALAVRKCPSVLSIHKLSRDMHLGYWHPPDAKEAYSVDADNQIKLVWDIENDVPFMDDDATAQQEPANTSRVRVPMLPGANADPPTDVVEGVDNELEDIESVPSSKKERLQKEALSIRPLRRHRRKNPFCETCQRAMAMFRQHRRLPEGKRRTFKEFGEMVTADEIRLTRDDNIAIDGSDTGLFPRPRYQPLACRHLKVEVSRINRIWHAILQR